MFYTIVLSSEEHTLQNPRIFCFRSSTLKLRKLNSYSKFQDEDYTPIFDLVGDLGLFAFQNLYLSD